MRVQKRVKFMRAGFILISCMILVSCKPKVVTPPDAKFNIWVLNEGVWGMNNGSITAYNTATYERDADIYSSANKGQKLGDLPNDILLYGAKIYVAVSTSNQVNVMDSKTGVSIKQIAVVTDGTASQPRQIVSHNGKVYVCCYDGSVVKIDTASLAIETVAKAGRNPDGICVANNKLYVSNSGGLDWETGNYDNTVSVFELSTLNKIKDIEVRINPEQMKTDKNGNIYLLSKGNYMDISSCLQRISTTDKVEILFENLTGFDIYNNYLYFFRYDFMSGNTSYQVFDLLQNSIINANFISGDKLPQTPNGISINPNTGDIYILDALDYTSTGDVYCFDRNGKKKFQFEAGIIPKKAIFK